MYMFVPTLRKKSITFEVQNFIYLVNVLNKPNAIVDLSQS